jgi:predicted ribosomally synthesized peptide with nif11-like leader
VKDLQRFVTDVKTNQQLQNELRDKVGASALIEVGKKHGYNITEEDVKAYAASQKAEMTEEELEAVAGGAFPRILIIIRIIEPF